MLHLAVLIGLLTSSTPQAAETPVLKGEIKDVPPQGKLGPAIGCDGTTNLPDGMLLNAYLYYDRVDEGREIAKDTATVKGGKFSLEFAPFPKREKNVAGRYIARFRFDPEFQVQAVSGWTVGRLEISLQIGTAQDVERDAQALRDQLAAEVRLFTAMGDEVKATCKELQDKPHAAWEPFLKGWQQKSSEIQARAIKVAEYRLFRLDQVADSGLENLTGILLSAARHAAGGKREDALEGITRLHQTASYWIDEISAPRLSDPEQIFQLIVSARKLLQDALARPDDPVLPARRKFVQMNALLQKSVSEDHQAAILEIGTRSVDFFTALGDKKPEAKELYQELDKAFERLVLALRRPPKGS